MIKLEDIDNLINKIEKDVVIEDPEKKAKTSEAQKRANEKYRNKIKKENPELYKERLRKYGYKQFLKKKDTEEYKIKSREYAKKYYYKNAEKISIQRKEQYNKKKQLDEKYLEIKDID